MVSAVELYVVVPTDNAEHVPSRLGRRIPPSEVEVRRPVAGRYRLRDERLLDDALGAGRGGVLGSLGGALVGSAVALVMGASVVVGVLVVLAFAALAALAGAMWGLQRREPEDDDPAVDLLIEDSDAARLVVVRRPSEREWARRVLERDFDGQPVDAPVPDAEPDPAPRTVTLDRR